MEQRTSAIAGWTAFVMGALALLAAMAVFWGGPFAPQQPVDVSLGQLAAGIAKNAAAAAVGREPPPPEAVPRDLDDWLQLGVAMVAGIAVVAGIAALVRHEPPRPAIAGAALGGAAIAFQLFTFTIGIIVGAIIIFGLLAALGDTFTGIFGG